MNILTLLTVVFLDPFLNLLMLLYKLLGSNMGLAIIAVTILFKLVALPLSWKSLHSQRRMQQLKPHLDTLKDKHKDDRTALAQAQMELYKEHGLSPVGGCLPMLIQLPFLFGVYAALRTAVSIKQVGDLNSHLYSSWLHIQQVSDIHLHFLWVNLAKPDVLYILPVLAGLTQLGLSWMMMPPKSALPKPETKKEASLEDSMMSAQRQMVFLFPILTAVIALSFPSGLSIYWIVGNLFSIIQQFYINRALPHPMTMPVLATVEAPQPKAKKPRPTKKK